MILLVGAHRAHGADGPLGSGVLPAVSAPTEHLETEYRPERGSGRLLAEPSGQVPEEKKGNQGPLPTDGIALRFDGILCHALSVFAMLFSVMP